MGETEIHVKQILDLYASLSAHFRDEPEVHVNADLFLYYEEGNPSSCVAPDVMVTHGIPPGFRRVYKTWVEGKVPSVVFEITSKGTRLEDLGSKKATYEMLGIPEYYIFDPLGEYLTPPLRAYRLHGSDYVDVTKRRVTSPALGLDLRLVDGFLRLADPRSGRLLPIPEDLKDLSAEAVAANRARVVAEERAFQEASERAAADERARAAEERAQLELSARVAAEQEAARLRALLQRRGEL